MIFNLVELAIPTILTGHPKLKRHCFLLEIPQRRKSYVLSSSLRTHQQGRPHSLAASASVTELYKNRTVGVFSA